MQNRRPVEPNVSPARQARDGAAAADDRVNLPFGNSPKPMRARGDKQWRICRVRAVQMDSSSEHAFDDGERRLNMYRAGLLRPVLEPGRSAPAANGNRTILVPGQRPIGCRILVEEDSTNRSRVRPQNRTGDPSDFAREQPTLKFRIAVDSNSGTGSRRRQDPLKILQLISLERARQQFEPVALKLKCQRCLSSPHSAARSSRRRRRASPPAARNRGRGGRRAAPRSRPPRQVRQGPGSSMPLGRSP